MDTTMNGAPLGTARSRYDLMPQMTPLMESITFHGLPGAAEIPRDRSIWKAELEQIVARRVSAIGLAAARAARIDDDDSILDGLRSAHTRGALRSSLVAGLAASAVEAFDRLGIPFLITKGPGIAHLYQVPEWRPYRDVDVLVRPKDFRLAKEALATLDFAEPASFKQPRGYFDRFCREGVNLLRADGAAIDLHHHVPPWIWGARLQLDVMLESAVELKVMGKPLPVASPVHNLLVTALHVISDRGHGGHELLMWRDLATVAGTCDPEEAAREAHRTGLAWILAIVIDALPANVRPDELIQSLGATAGPRLERMRLRHLLPPSRLARHQIARAFRYPLPNALGFLVGFGLPSRRFLRQRYGGAIAYPTWWKDASTGLRAAANHTQVRAPRTVRSV